VVTAQRTDTAHGCYLRFAHGRHGSAHGHSTRLLSPFRTRSSRLSARTQHTAAISVSHTVVTAQRTDTAHGCYLRFAHGRHGSAHEHSTRMLSPFRTRSSRPS